METRALLAFALSVAILVGYQMIFETPVPRQAPPASTGLPSTDAVGGVVAQTSALRPPVPLPPLAVADQGFDSSALGPEVTREVTTEQYSLIISSHGGRLKSFKLNDYRTSAGQDSPSLDMVSADGRLPLGVYWRRGDGSVGSDRGVAYELTSRRTGGGTSIEMMGSTAAGQRITKRLTAVDGSYLLAYDVEISGHPTAAVGVAWSRTAVKTNRWGGQEGPAAFIDGALEFDLADKLDEPAIYSGQVSWAGYADHYFLAAYYPSGPRTLGFEAVLSGGVAEAVLWDEQAGGTVSYELFVGPKSVHLLDEVGHDLAGAVNLGWFAIIARPLLELMLFFERFTGNYGWAILLLTAGIRVVFYPVNKRQATAMKAMKKIQPELKKIQERFKDDRERLNKEMMELYRRHKVNPLSGCLPMLLQLPVFLGLYNALLQSIELRHAPFLGWITDLSQPDRLGSLAIPFVTPSGIPIMTLLMGLSMFVQQKMTPAAGDPTQQKMMMFMPVIFTVMFVNFPSGLVLYWLANNIFSIAQQYMTNRSKG